MNVVNLAIAFGAGILSITSPCCLPLLPGYVGYLSGVNGSQPHRGRAVLTAGLFVVGFTAVFALLGAGASELGHVVLRHRRGLEQVAGGLIITTGLLLVATDRMTVLARGGDWTRRWAHGQVWAAPILGASFAITWTPCIGPVLAGILALASSTQSLGQGVTLLVVYSLGLGAPLMLLTASLGRLQRVLRHLGRAATLLRPASGALLVVMGALLITDRWLPLMTPLIRVYSRAQWPPV